MRITGPFFLLVGVGIAATLAYVVFFMARALLRNSMSSTPRYMGSPLELTGAFAIVSAACFIGITFAAIGVWQILRGTRSHHLIRLGTYSWILVVVAFALLQWWY